MKRREFLDAAARTSLTVAAAATAGPLFVDERQTTVSGRVLGEGKPLSGVLVSDGCHIVRTNDRGEYQLAVGPDSEPAFKDYWQKESLPFVGLADPTHTVARRYGQEVRLLKGGRMPALMVISKDGEVAYKHYGGSMSDIPPNTQILAILDELNR